MSYDGILQATKEPQREGLYEDRVVQSSTFVCPVCLNGRAMIRKDCPSCHA